MLWFTNLFRRSAPKPKVQPQEPQATHYGEVKPPFDLLDAVEKECSHEEALCVGISQFKINSGCQFSEWQAAIADLERSGLISCADCHDRLVMVMTSEHHAALSSLAHAQAEGPQSLKDLGIQGVDTLLSSWMENAKHSAQNIDACLRYLLPLRLLANTAPAPAPSRRQGRL